MADTCIGRVPEAAACANKFKREGVSITLSVTPCWCYGSETMDMDPHTIKGVWGFNGTERPGAVYLAAVLAGHAQKGLPAFGIYGHEVQDRDQVTQMPEDVKEKLLRFGRAAVAVATMRGKSYLQIGADLITMCSMLRIPVCMHNVPEDDIYRPACWNAFGMDKEGQDYRACATYGPLYK